MELPVYYDYQNAYNSRISPSTVHVKNTGLQWFFRRYLLQKIISVYKWEIPETWARNYFLYVLYCDGYLAVVNTDKYGVICQQCTLSGYDIFYQPANALIANPLLTGILEPRIGLQCEIVKLQPDYGGVLDIVNFYSDMLALCAESAGVNMLNTKLAYVFACEGKAQAESFKKLYDSIASGEPAVFADKNLFTDDGNLKTQFFNQNVRNTYIAGDILDDMRRWEMKFDNDIGIPTSNTMKKERLITGELEHSEQESKSKCELWLDELQSCCRKVTKMFPNIKLWVDWRDKDERNTVTDGAL